MRELSASHLSPIQCFPDFALGEQERQLNMMFLQYFACYISIGFMSFLIRFFLQIFYLFLCQSCVFTDKLYRHAIGLHALG